MDLIEESYSRLFPEKSFNYQTELGYNLRLSDFNANIRLRGQVLSVNLNLQWKDIDEEIKIGLVQSLLNKIFKAKKQTRNIEMYNHFIKNIPSFTPKVKNDPILEESFIRVNWRFFNNSLEQPNLQWGLAAFHKLASYNFHEDAVTVSSIFKDCKEDVLDYLMYHELLHKELQFKHKNGRSAFHTKEFREREKQFLGFESIDREIKSVIVREKNRNRKFFKLGFFGI
ncbi:hypothetical protein J4437_03045 [Candidatus Woesearchaeota archaeon]|nr:hypothetical protein [Candidatus Woesearchaeota archaeon]